MTTIRIIPNTPIIPAYPTNGTLTPSLNLPIHFSTNGEHAAPRLQPTMQEMFVGSTHDYVLFVTDRGRLFRIKGYTIAEGSRTSKGSNIVNLLQLAEGEKVITTTGMVLELRTFTIRIISKISIPFTSAIFKSVISKS